jgi:predicted metal-dependent hydrolase
LEFRTGELVLVLPKGSDPEEIFRRHKKWADDKIKRIEECREAAKTKDLVQRGDKDFQGFVHQFIVKISQKLNVKINSVIFRPLKTKWASISHKKNLTFNTMMRFLPDHLIEYIVFHEIAHSKHKHHNADFWKMISRRFKNYQDLEEDLFIYWFKLTGEK